MAWMIDVNKLDPNQKELYNRTLETNIWIKGFAGSGKSVLLIHKLKKILYDEPEVKICIVVYTLSMIDLFKTGMNELGMPSTIPVITYLKFDKEPTEKKYDYIFCDEVQDLPENVLVLMNNRLNPKGKIIVAGDSNQSIYPDKVDPKRIGEFLGGAKEESLLYIHRLTRTIINVIQKILPSANMWGADKEFTQPDKSIFLRKAEKEENEVEYIYHEALKGPDSSFGNNQETSAILIPTHKNIIKFVQLLLQHFKAPLWIEKLDKFDKPDFTDLNIHLKHNNIRIQYIGNGRGSLEDAVQKKDVIIMTYHSSKGLDFDNVFLPFMAWDLFIDKFKPDTLLMVAITRTKKNLCISYTGKLHNKIEMLTLDKSIDIVERSIVVEKKAELDNDDFDLGF